MIRRLPIYFLIDVSESMVGEPLQLVEEGMASIIKELKTDPYAIETAWVSIIIFAGQAKTLVPLQEIIQFYPPRFPIGGGTSLSKGLGHLMYELRKNQIKTTHDQKGDWKPIVFLFTDGVPTDETKSAIQEWKQNWQRTANMVAISFGGEADSEILSELTSNVLMFKNADSAAYKKFFKWVTDSIKTSSISVENNTGGFDLAKIDGDTLSKIDLNKSTPGPKVDDNFVVLTAKCQNTKRPYLMKYQKELSASGIMDYQTKSYRLKGAYPVDNEYFNLSEEGNSGMKVNTDELVGFPGCPSCGNPYGIAVCSCGGIHCAGDESWATCPWCGNRAEYGAGKGGFDLGRARG